MVFLDSLCCSMCPNSTGISSGQVTIVIIKNYHLQNRYHRPGFKLVKTNAHFMTNIILGNVQTVIHHIFQKKKKKKIIRTYFIAPPEFRQLSTKFEWQNLLFAKISDENIYTWSLKSKLNLSKGQISSGFFPSYLVFFPSFQ